MIAKPGPVEKAHADGEGGDMNPTKERECQTERNGRKSQYGKGDLLGTLSPDPWDFTALMPIPVD